MKRHAYALLTVVLLSAAAGAAEGRKVTFKKTRLDATFRAEGVAVGDVNHDGKIDVITGDVWYAAPDWKMHEIRKVGTYSATKGYSLCFANFAADCNGDGWVDSVLIGFPGRDAFWYENPQNKPGHWKRHRIWKSACNETPVFGDLLGDGKPVPVFGSQPDGIMGYYPLSPTGEGPGNRVAISAPKAPGTQRFSHGLGIGDVNGDGRQDVIVRSGWWEAPADRAKGPWTFHKVNLGGDCATMWAYDLDGDGDNDIISSSAHNYGIWWHEHVKTDKGITFQQHEISKVFSQSHALELADVNGDGTMDIVVGKRHFAHNGGDPGGKDPAVLYWFEVRRGGKSGQVQFIPHKIDDNSGVGTQFTVADINGDGKVDVITSNKLGVHVFVQE